MSSRTILTVVVIILIALGAYWYFKAKPVSAPGTNTPTAAQTTSPSGSSASNTSDAAITKDTASIDAQMNALNADSAATNQTDVPVTQSY